MHRSLHFSSLRLSSLLCALLAAPPAAAQSADTTRLAGMQARAIGPAGMSGRVTTIEAIERDPAIIYIGSASGSVWKSTSGGTH